MEKCKTCKELYEHTFECGLLGNCRECEHKRSIEHSSKLLNSIKFKEILKDIKKNKIN